MKGAVISSTATPDKNTISTGSLTYSNINNNANYNSSSVGVNLNTNPNAKYNQQGLTPNIGVPASGDGSSTTQSAISPGTIIVRSNPNQDLSGLSRDPSNSLNALGKIFDREIVAEQQELAQQFGVLAYEQVHIMSQNAQDAAQKELDAAKKNGASQDVIDGLQAKVDSWGEGGANKIALHALVGGIMSDLGGSGFTSGAVGAGINQAVQQELSKLKDQPDLWQWASAVVGATATSIVGGNAQAGASTAASGTKNNEGYLGPNQFTPPNIDSKKMVQSLIANGYLADPDTMKKDGTNDYQFVEVGVGIGKTGVAAGYMLDAMGNVYGIADVNFGPTLGAPVTVTTGGGSFTNFNGSISTTRTQYVDSLEGVSLGATGGAGGQGNISISTSTISGEVSITPGIGGTVGGRIATFLFNIKD